MKKGIKCSATELHNNSWRRSRVLLPHAALMVCAAGQFCSSVVPTIMFQRPHNRDACFFMMQEAHPLLVDHVAKSLTRWEGTCFAVGLGQISLSSSPLLPALH